MGSLALRDHAAEILRAAARDMISPQTSAEQSAKSKGQGEAGDESDQLNGASDEHALARVESGFDLMEVVSEYRALRASVIRLWRQSRPELHESDLDDLTRFNESVDQSLAKAVRSYTHRVNHSREMFLAILSHDLRNPLSAVRLLAQALTKEPQLSADAADMAARIGHEADVIARMVTDLLEFTRTRIGSAMPIAPGRTDLAELCREVVAESQAAHPDRTLHLRCEGDLAGEWDAQRLRQVVSNLLANAVRHGAPNTPVDITATPAPAPTSAPARHGTGDDDDVAVAVHNHGPAIPPQALPTLFDPLVRLASRDLHKPRPDGGIGLGLYIVRQIVTAHGGAVAVDSTDSAGTTFTIRLPRHPRRPRV